MQNTSDEYILQLIAQPMRQQQGFRLLLEQYQERLYWHIRRMVVEHEDANDVLQNCLLKVFRNISKFKQQAKLYTWLYRIATNEAITFLNKKKRLATTSLDSEEGVYIEQIKADSFFDGDAAQQKLQRAIQKLPEKQKLVFNMRYYDEMPYLDISEILETSVGALKASYHHAVKKIEVLILSDSL